ncbi:kunitz-type serine protease inhibitor LmKTT-1a-like [Centruroides sculpturatus]|uniref:kunitz-type serine protease inhibitor LmKTT-1a-like n=1 Tax=Centruroides sculpturatus TaxID=218467 RepID=UPI000C6E10A7|nr:kunitz-type serine protease inhibitor LmKTT-1a-like [Centruroides sculpturatus]
MKSILVVVAILCLLFNSFADAKKDCFAKPDAGRGRALLKRYYYNSETSTCDIFLYGGTGGNGNNFLSESGCCQICKHGSC